MGRILKGRGVLDAQYLTALESAREVIEQGSRAARRIREDAIREADAIRREAREQGRQEGLARASAVLVEAETLRCRHVQQAMEDMVELSLEAAAALHGHCIEVDRELAARVLEQAVDQLDRSRSVTLTVSPEDLDAARALADGHAGRIQVLSDESIRPGGCTVRSEAGLVDGRLETRLDALREALMAVVNITLEKS